jgi:hypothetical protein
VLVGLPADDSDREDGEGRSKFSEGSKLSR